MARHDKMTRTVEVDVPCWYEVCRIEGDAYDDEVAPLLEREDTSLAPTCAMLDSLIERLDARRHSDAPQAGGRKPIKHQPTLLKTSYCPPPRDRMVSLDETERACVFWVKGTCTETREVPVEDADDGDPATTSD